MGRTIQVDDLPDHVLPALEARAARLGITLTELARRTLVEAASRPSREELLAELEALEPLDIGESSADAIRAVRAEYE